MYKNHTHCRACGLGKPSIPTLKVSTAAGPDVAAQQLVPVMDLGLQPLANDFADMLDEHAGFAPLKVMLCPRCNLSQLSIVVNPKDLYRHYSYVTSKSETMNLHFHNLMGDIMDESGFGSVVEIGSNDGTLLRKMRMDGFGPVMGIDPAENLCAISTANGVDNICSMFGFDSAQKALDHMGQPHIIIARHVFCHIDDWRNAIKCMEMLADKETAIFIEVPYVMDMLKDGSFDTIYHEHLSYLNVRSMEYALKESKLHLHAIKRYPIHGGAIVMTLRRNDWADSPDESVAWFLSEERSGVEEWRKFSQESEVRIMQLGGLVRNLVSEGKTIVGYGASAKSTVWINACGFTRKEIKYICDNTPQKQYKVSPGTNIPICDDGALTRDLPTHALCWAWNFRDEIIEKEQIFRKHGGKWIFPTPNVEVI